jgi:hypothetical protein
MVMDVMVFTLLMAPQRHLRYTIIRPKMVQAIRHQWSHFTYRRTVLQFLDQKTRLLTYR